MTYYIPDLTGQNPDYLRTNDIYTWFQVNQKIVFETPIFANSLVIKTTDGLGTALVQGTDWQINNDDVDTTTMSRALNGSTSFSAVLLRSITVIRNTNLLPLQVAMTYQQFYLTTPTSPVASGTDTIDVTPDLIIDMLRRITVVEQADAKVPNVLASSTATPVLLDYDINGTNPNNLITAEAYTINTFNNMSVIRPIQGSFFKNSLVLVAGGQTFVQGTDYLAVECNLGKTKVTTDPGGIYDLILVTTGYAGPVSLTYQAVGGLVVTSDLKAVYGEVEAITQFLNGAGFVTQDSLVDTTAYQNLLNQLNSMETQLRSLLSGSPTYGDTTTGTTVVKRIRANDTNLHWWTVASLYQVAGSTDIVQADRISLHIQLSSENYLADIDVAVDLLNQNNPFTATATNVVYDPGFQIYGNVSALASSVPMTRVIYNTTQNNVTGVLLQLGFALGGLTDTLTVEDRSGVESCWKLDTTQGSVSSPILPSDTSVTLPDGVSVWSSTGTTSVSSVQTLQNKTGYLIYAGLQVLTGMDDASSGALALSQSLPAYFRIQDIQTVKLYMTDVNNNAYLSIIPMTGTSPAVRRGVAAIPISAGDTSGLMEIIISYQAGTTTTNPVTVTARVHGLSVIADKLAIRYLVAQV